MRDVPNRYRGLPSRTPEMLYNVVRKFYRGAVSHYDLIQEKKREAYACWEQMQASGDDRPLRAALTTLFLEFHFYVTCWLQIELALYRLARQDERLALVMEKFRTELERHVAVRGQLEQTEACVAAQFAAAGSGWSCPGVEQDAYVFDGFTFTVDESSLAELHALFAAIEEQRQLSASEKA
ncbi:hypothetical protein EDM57_10805 [Brevibacillus gelatini]|uniref:Uncharacterized protein n=1 Tax=Brevibacillus gelatini TaxID=1655277 RepID=A0A3M8B050_9BACL|nr:hypothetical protein [Brevibacillus gelatini]RNB56808.1 hypothetical protein EDM57_10805 [Brevibacillus gelatini]